MQHNLRPSNEKLEKVGKQPWTERRYKPCFFSFWEMRCSCCVR